MINIGDSVWLGELFEKQARFDEFVLSRRDSEISDDVIVSETLNAYLVELGEFLNEVRAFKHWSEKRMSRDEAFEEYIDGLHFLLSLGNQTIAGLDIFDLENKVEDLYSSIIVYPSDRIFYYLKEKDCLESSSEFVDRSIDLFTESKVLLGENETEYVDYFLKYMFIGFSVGMTIGDINREYRKKNEINYQRQLNGY